MSLWCCASLAAVLLAWRIQGTVPDTFQPAHPCRDIAPVKYMWTQLAAPKTWEMGMGSFT